MADDRDTLLVHGFHDTLLVLVRQASGEHWGGMEAVSKTMQKLMKMYQDALAAKKKDPADFIVIGDTALRKDSIDAVYPDLEDGKCWVKVGDQGVIVQIKAADLIQQL